jgi:amino acid permease
MVRFMLILSTLLLAGPAIAHGGGGHHGGGYYVHGKYYHHHGFRGIIITTAEATITVRATENVCCSARSRASGSIDAATQICSRGLRIERALDSFARLMAQ